jgi:hypothetical protein
VKSALQWLKDKKRFWWLGFVALLAVSVLLSSGNGLRAGGGSGASQEERRIAEVLSAMAGAGRVEVALFYENEAVSAFGGGVKTRPTGAVVVAQGAGDMQVRLELGRAVRTLLGLPENAVDVFEMEDTKQ